jgi:hypothetical protein
MGAQSSPMLQALTLPGSWGELLQMLRPVFLRSSTFGLFALLATGLVARTTRRTVVGMLAGAGMAALVSFHPACRFISHHVWDTDRLGLAVARLIVDRLLPADAADHRRGRRPPCFAAGAARCIMRSGPTTGPRRDRPSSAAATGGSSSGSSCGCRSARIRCACRFCSGCGPARAPPPRSSWLVTCSPC